MGRTDGGDNDSIHILGCDDALPGGLCPAAKVLGNLLRPTRIDIGDCPLTYSGQCLGDTADMILPNVSGSDNSNSDGHFENTNFVLKPCRESLKRIWKRSFHGAKTFNLNSDF